MMPIIGMLANVDNERTASVFGSYAAAVETAGGVAVLLPYTEKKETLEEYASLCHGFFFTGGADVSPLRYGEEVRPVCGELFPDRDALEFAFFPLAFATGKPLLGVCRGHQVVNVALGGTLYQDLTESQATVLHRQKEPKTEPSHEIFITPNTPLSALIGKERMMGNSFHHQAIKTLGEGLAVMASAADGMIEAVYHVSHPYLRCYQWHPERLFRFDSGNLRLFGDFVSACKG